MRRHALALFVGSILCVTASSGALLAADTAIAVRPAATTTIMQEAACLRWVWQEYSWYDDCWAQRHPYLGRSSWVGPAVRRVYR